MPESPTICNAADMLREALAGQQITAWHSRLKKAAASQSTKGNGHSLSVP